MRNSIGWVCIGTLLFARAAVAADWLTEPSVGVSAEYDDNPFLTTLDHDTRLRTVLRPALRLKGGTETTVVQTDAWLRFDRYPGQSDANSDNGGVRFDSAWGSEVQHADLTVDLAQDSTLQTELLDTGLTQTAKERRSALISPSWYYLVTQSTSVGIDYGYSKVDYASGAQLTDYRYQTVSASMAQQLGATSEWSLAVFGAGYVTDDDLSRFWNTGLELGLVHDFSERSHGRISAGARHTTSRNEFFSTIFRDSSNGGVVDAKLEHGFDRASLHVEASRDVQPSGAGYLQQSDLLNLGWRYPFTPQWTVSVDATFYHHKSLTDYRTAYDRHYQTIQPRVEWQWARRWVASGYARYARSKYAQDPDAATANVVGVQVNFRWSGADL